jgi:hypothetical protein
MVNHPNHSQRGYPSPIPDPAVIGEAWEAAGLTQTEAGALM